VVIITTGYWIWILPSRGREIPKDWDLKGDKWLIFGKREELEELAKKIEPYVERGLIHSAKYSPEENSVMCVYCLDYEREKVWQILEKLGVKKRIWKYDYQTMQDWSIGGKLWLKEMSNNDVLRKKIVKILKKSEEELKRKELIAIKASTLADYFWCAKKSYLKFLMENSPMILNVMRNIYPDSCGPEFLMLHPFPEKINALIQGIKIHGRSYGFFVAPMEIPQKEKVYEMARTGRVIPRNMGKYQIQGAVDELIEEKDGYRIKEIKTTSKEDRVNPYTLFPARFQLKIYGWILSAYLPIKSLHLVVISQATSEVLHEEHFRFDEKDAETRICDALRRFENKDFKPPKQWKCKYCEVSNICRNFY